jgi:tRNA pseudouridine55 synthase
MSKGHFSSHHKGGALPTHEPHDGILLVNKPSGPTSHDIVDAVRKKFRIDKVGHGGTLDPRATGLLILLLGRGTKLSNAMMSSDKIYTGVMKLGEATDSQDADGEVISTAEFSDITAEALQEAMRAKTGDSMQTPPMVSAVKKDGVPLYKLARKGKTVQRDARLIHVYSFSLDAFTPPLADFTVSCTKGTYVRTLCHEVGEALGCGAHLAELTRTASGQYKLEDAVDYNELMTFTDEQLIEKVISIHKVKASLHQA